MDFFISLGKNVNRDERMHPIDFGGQRSKVKVATHVNRDERLHPIDFGGQRSKVKVTLDIYGNKLVNTIET